MASLDDLRNHPMVLYPPVSEPIIWKSQDPVIFLAGSVTGIFIEKTWHSSMIEKLEHFGFEGKVYIPCRLDSNEILHYSRELNLQEDENNLYTEQRSFAIVYWGGGVHESVAIKHLLSLVWMSSDMKRSERKRPFFFFGANEGSRALKEFDALSRHMRIYSHLSQVASDIVDKVHLLAV